MNNPNERQVGGDHYKSPSAEDQRQHWDMCYLYDWDYFFSAASKYVDRLGRKDDPRKELSKAIHYLEKYLSLRDGRENRSDVPAAAVKRGHVITSEVKDFVTWASRRGYTGLQTQFNLLLIAHEPGAAITLLRTAIAEYDCSLHPCPEPGPEPGPAYVNQDGK